MTCTPIYLHVLSLPDHALHYLGSASGNTFISICINIDPNPRFHLQLTRCSCIYICVTLIPILSPSTAGKCDKIPSERWHLSGLITTSCPQMTCQASTLSHPGSVSWPSCTCALPFDSESVAQSWMSIKESLPVPATRSVADELSRRLTPTAVWPQSPLGGNDSLVRWPRTLGQSRLSINWTQVSRNKRQTWYIPAFLGCFPDSQTDENQPSNAGPDFATDRIHLPGKEETKVLL